MPKKSFRFELYSVHGHLKDGPPDYLALIRELSGLAGYHRQSGEYHIVVGRSESNNGQLFLVIYTGTSDKSTLFFDLQANLELNESIHPGRFQARKTHLMIDANKRLLAIETKRGGIGAVSLEGLIEEYAATRENINTLELEFNPIADADFLDRLNAFRRIQAATITIARPNVDWTDRHNQLTDVANESDAGALDVTARAKKGKSLSKEHGLIEYIKQGASSVTSMFKKIKIVGSFGDANGLITLNLSRHIEHTNISLDTDSETGLPSESTMQSRLSAYLQQAQTGAQQGGDNA